LVLEEVRSSDSIGLRLPYQALFFTAIFLPRERVQVNELDLIHKLIRTVDRFTRNADNTVIAEHGRSVIRQIVRALTDEQFRDVCCHREFLEDLESIDRSLFGNVNEKCKSVF
jgi:hypothetical protein